MDLLTSQMILRGLQQQNADDAWHAFCERYQPMLQGLSRRAGLQEHDAQDVVQEALAAFVDAFRAGKYDETRGRLRSWLKGIAVNKIRDARRQRGRLGRQVVDGPDSTGFMNRIPDDAELEDVFEQEWEAAMLRACLQRVRQEVQPNTFLAFKLYAIDGKAPDDVAAELEITRDAVYVSKTRVMARLQHWQAEFQDSW